MTLKEATIKTLRILEKPSTYQDVCNYIIKNNYYDFGDAKTPPATISAVLGGFIRTGDSRVKRIKEKKGYIYYLKEFENNLNIGEIHEKITKSPKKHTYLERDLHILLNTYLKSNHIFSKTIFHEKSTGNDNHQKWIHPDMVGVNFLNLENKISHNFLKSLNKEDTFKITSYELKKEITTDYDLKKCFFQAVSNSSWANYGYLVAFEISPQLTEEMQRLNQSFGIGIIELKANPFESKVIYPSKYKNLDFKTMIIKNFELEKLKSTKIKKILFYG